MQAFRIGVAKVDQDVAHVAMAIHVCLRCMFQMFQLYQTCCKYFHLEVANVDMNVAYTCML
jgi:hypothetical protein